METPGQIADYAERPRSEGWTLRSALVRYAQPEPARAGAVLELVRRTDAALKPHLHLLEREPSLEQVARDVYDRTDGASVDFEAPQPFDDVQRSAVQLLVVALGLDAMGDALVAWAAAVDTERPDGRVDALARQAFTLLAELGVERETRPPRRA